jgi:hypothetical protein
MTSSWPNIMPAKKLFLGSPLLPSSIVKKTAFCINWLNYHDNRCGVNKYINEHNSSHKSTIQEDISFLLSMFTAKEIKITFAVTLLKFNFSFHGLEQLPLRKNKMIESFSQYIYDHKSVFEHSVKSDKRYVL